MSRKRLADLPVAFLSLGKAFLRPWNRSLGGCRHGEANANVWREEYLFVDKHSTVVKKM
jgi:hypothetical protein